MALILPKGIVVNSPEIEGSIERINTEPLDLADIAKFWKVYTTTKRRLLDPTAERLENYWWRIWGSRSRELKGATVARLFAYISDGQSFVPLRGPANRDEGPPPLERKTRHGLGASSTTAIHQSSESSTASSSALSKTPVTMPHPILKKSRGPSSTGPRPTARFISPQESEEDSDPHSSISANSHVVVQPPSPDPQNAKVDKKSSSTGGKKKAGGFVAHVAHSAAKKKRPVIARRQSSQTSQSSTDSAARGTDGAGALHSSSERTPPTFSELAHARGKQPTQSRFQENFSPSSEKSLTTPSPRKRSPGRKSDTKQTSSRRSTPGGQKLQVETSKQQRQDAAISGDPGPSSQLRPIENKQTAPTGSSQEDIEVQRLLLAEANARIQQKPRATSHVTPPPTHDGFRILHSSLRSRSDGDKKDGMSAVRIVPQESKSTASLAPTLADAAGQLDTTRAATTLAKGASGSESPKRDKGKARDATDARQVDMFAKRPVQPIIATSIPDSAGSLSRSKSQLTMLLERDRTSSIEKKPKDDSLKRS